MNRMRLHLMLRTVCTFAAAIAFAGVAAAQTVVPKDFKVELVAQPPEVEHPSVVTCDDSGGLFVGEDPMDMRGPTTKEFDRVLYITFNADGSIKRKTVFCDNLAAVFGLIWHDGALYVMHAPHYTMFKDTDGDGVADVRKDLAKGFGPPAGVFGFNDHIVTGTRLGMDGFVYVSVGDKGIQKATSLSDKSAVTLEGGGVVRMRLDGTQLENFTSGTRNHLDVAMDALDNIFTYDNTDDGLGWWTRFTYHMPTGYYGYPYDYLTRPQRHLPRLSEHGGGSPVGGDGYREAYWPAKYRGAIFYCEWGKGKVQVFFPKKNGASFDVTMEDFLVKAKDAKEEFRPLDLCFSPDGKHMYVADWNYGGWTNPKVAGRVYRVTYIGADAKEEPASPFSARGKGEAPGTPAGESAATADLIKTLSHPGHARRMQAQWALAKRGIAAVKPLNDVLADKAQPTHARIHALWALHAMVERVDDFTPVAQFIHAMHNGPDELRAQAARALGTKRIDASSTTAAVKGLIHRAKNDKDAFVRMQAAVTLGRLGAKEAAVELFASLDDGDDFARFAKVQALRAINEWAVAPAFLNSSDERTREGTILALTGVYADGAVMALDMARRSNPHAGIRARAVEALAEVARKADPYVKGWWGTQPARGKQARTKKNDWDATAAIVSSIRDALKDDDAAVRLAAIRAIQEVDIAGGGDALAVALANERSPDMRIEIIRAWGKTTDNKAVHPFVALAEDRGEAVAVRRAALDGLRDLKQIKKGMEIAGKIVADDETPPALMIAGLEWLHLDVQGRAAEAVRKRAKHADPAVRAAAITADAKSIWPDTPLRQSDQKTIDALRALFDRIKPRLNDEDVGVRAAAMRAIPSIAANDAVAPLTELTRRPADRATAIEVLAAFSQPAALSVYLEGLTDRNPAIRTQCAAALTKLRHDIVNDLLALHKANELRPEVRRELASLFSTPQPIRQWRLIGAWAKDGPQPTFDLNNAPNAKEPVKLGDRLLTWRTVSTQDETTGVINPTPYVKPNSDCWAMAHAIFETRTAGTYAWSLGSDDQAVLYVNGKKIYEYSDNRGYSAGSAKGSVELAAGINHIYFQTGNSGGPWQFSFAIGGRDEKLAFLYKDTPPQLDITAYRNHAAKDKGDAKRGKEIFFDANGVGCVKCHAVGKEGASTVGPNLLAIGAKYPREELIRSILEPSSRIVSGYELTLVETTDGERHAGKLDGETDTDIKLLTADAKVIKIAKKEIVEQRKSTLSMMPNGLEKGLTLQDFADIVAYLESQKQ